jgi:hypothetical protein
MTKFRAALSSLAFATALATSAAHADVYKTVRLTDMLVSAPHDDLPAPPKFSGAPPSAPPKLASPAPRRDERARGQDLADWQANYGASGMPSTRPNALTLKPAPKPTSLKLK